MKLDNESILQRAFDIDLRVEGERISVNVGGQNIEIGSHGLMILGVFDTPKTLAHGLKELQATVCGTRDWIRLTQQIVGLASAGSLRQPHDQIVPFHSDPGRFSSPNVHIRMLNDLARTKAYQTALFKLVGSDDIVLDIGTGTGILAATAALAGARHVYAVERSPSMAKLAKLFFANNGFSERITILEGDSTRLELPERADVLVSEIIGNDPLVEGILDCYNDARQRLLKPNARVIPRVLRIFALPLSAPKNYRERLMFTKSSTEKWGKLYGLDFDSYAEDSARRDFHCLINSFVMRDWPRIAQPLLVADIDLQSGRSVPAGGLHEFVALQSGTIDAIAVLFDTELAENTGLSTLPDETTRDNSWANLVWLLGAPLKVQKGDPLVLDYQLGARNESLVKVRSMVSSG